MTGTVLRCILPAAFLVAGTAVAMAQSGLVGKAEKLPPITLSSGAPLADKPLTLKAGTYYKLAIKSDGSAEMDIRGPAFFRNCWINEIVINDIEVRPLGVDSIEFDDEGEADMSFVCMKPGQFELTSTGGEPLKVTVE